MFCFHHHSNCMFSVVRILPSFGAINSVIKSSHNRTNSSLSNLPQKEPFRILGMVSSSGNRDTSGNQIYPAFETQGVCHLNHIKTV